MPAWEIALIVFGVFIILLLINSLACFVLTNIRLFEINFNIPFEFKFSEYRDDKERMLKDFKFFESQKFEDFEIKSFDNKRLRAKLLRVKDNKKIAVCFHGYRSTMKNDFASVVEFYQRLGYSLLFVNQRAHGKSRGVGITFGIKEKFDCQEWVNFVDKKFNPDEIILVGVSMGASTVMMASGLELPSKVKAVIADCGYTIPYEIIKETIKTIHLPVYPTIWFVCFYAKIFLRINLKKESTINALKESEIPTIFIHGTTDGFIPCRMSVENFEAKKGRKKLVLIDGAYHAGAHVKNPLKYEEEVKKFLDNND